MHKIFGIFHCQIDDEIGYLVAISPDHGKSQNMGALFETSSDNVSLHLKNIFKEEELYAHSVTEEFSVTASDGKKYVVKHYNLDAIISVGYRVNSARATAFRQWATGVLRDYTLRGYVMDRQANGKWSIP